MRLYLALAPARWWHFGDRLRAHKESELDDLTQLLLQREVCQKVTSLVQMYKQIQMAG